MRPVDAETSSPVLPRSGVRLGLAWSRNSNNVIGGRERAKHIDIRKHFAHEVIQNGEMLLVRVPTASQLADIFTKGLHYPQWQACVEGILGKTLKPS